MRNRDNDLVRCPNCRAYVVDEDIFECEDCSKPLCENCCDTDYASATLCTECAVERTKNVEQTS